jgi:hypothetical protein
MNIGSGSMGIGFIFKDKYFYRNIVIFTAGRILDLENTFPSRIECKNRANTIDYLNNEIFNLIINTYRAARICDPVGFEKKVTQYV